MNKEPLIIHLIWYPRSQKLMYGKDRAKMPYPDYICVESSIPLPLSVYTSATLKKVDLDIGQGSYLSLLSKLDL